MANDYPVRFTAQLRQHLRALRKERGLTQAQLGALVGVSQARIAEIEANPGLVNFEQLMQLLSALGVTLSLHEAALPESATPAKSGAKKVIASTPDYSSRKTWAALSEGILTSTKSNLKKASASLPDYSVSLPQGSWKTTILQAGSEGGAASILIAPAVPNVETSLSGVLGVRQEIGSSTAYSQEALLNQLRMLNPDKDVSPASGQKFVVRPKKGSW